MTATIPKVSVYQKKTAPKTNPSLAGKVAVIGAFKTTATAPKVYKDLGLAQSELGNDDTFNGCKVLPQLFKGVDSILAVNVSTESSGTWTKTITTTNLAEALAKIKHERFDMLFIADTITDAFLPIITAFTANRMLIKLPIGYIGCVTGGNASAFATTAGLVDDYSYGLITQAVSVNDTSLDLLESAAYYCAIIANLNVGASMTAKQVPGVTALATEYTFETSDLGTTLVGLGFTTFRCFDRDNQIYEVVNSEQPNGYDLYINRARDYVIREFALHEFLGDRNSPKTHSEIEQELSRTKTKCVNALDLLADIEYSVIKKSPKCVDIHITRLLFDDVITDIDVYFTIEVQ